MCAKVVEGYPVNKLRTPCADKNDKLGWRSGASFELDGFSLGVRSNDRELLEQLLEEVPSHAKLSKILEVDVLLSFLRGGESRRRGSANYHLVYDGWTRVARTLDLAEALDAFRSSLEINRLTNSADELYVDCPVLDWKGRSVLLLSETRQAAEAFAAAATAAGASRFATKFPGLREGGEVCSFELPENRLSPGLLLRATHKARRRWRPHQESPGSNALALFGCAPTAAVTAPRAMRIAASFCSKTPGYFGYWDTLDDIFRFLESELG